MDHIVQPVSEELFLHPEINSLLAKNGYAIADVCSPADISVIAGKTNELLTHYQTDKGKFFNFGQLDDFDMRNRSYDLIEKEVLPLINPLLNHEQAAIYAGTHLIKPPGERTGFDPHQDNTMVDETKFRSYIIWMPLTAITNENGPVCVLPNSHCLGNIYRSVSIPWIFKKVKEEIKKNSVPVLLREGQVLIFDSALIHYSLPNLTSQTRIAVNAMVLHKNSSIIKCMYKNYWLKKFIDIYEVGMDYYLNRENEKKPDSDYQKMTTVPYTQKILDLNDFTGLYGKVQDQ